MMKLTKKIARVFVVCAATAGLTMAGSGIASASTMAPTADPSCLVESLQGAVQDPAGTLAAVLADPAGAVQADLECVKEVIGI